MTTDNVGMETPPSSPSREDDAAEEEAAAAAELERRPDGPFISDLTPVIRNSWYLDPTDGSDAAPANFPGLTGGDDDEDFMLISPHSSAARGLLRRTSLPREAPPSESQDRPTAFPPSRASASTSVFNFKSHDPANSTFKLKNEDVGDTVELGKFASFQGVGQYEKRVANAGGKAGAAPPTAIPSSPGDHQYRPFLRGRHGVEEMADADEVDAIFKSPRRQKGNKDVMLVSPGPTPPQLQGQQHEEVPDRCLHLARPYSVDERDWSIPSIRLANRVGQSSSSGHPMDSFASYTDLSEYTAEDDLDGSLHSYDNRTTPNRFSDIFQRKTSSSDSLADRIPQTVYSQDVCDVPPQSGSPTLLPEASDAMNLFLERVQGVSIENNGEARPRPIVDAAPPKRCSNRQGREGAAAEWLRELQDRSPTNPIAEAASSKFFGGGSGPATTATEEGEDDESALAAPRPLCRSSTIGAG